LAYAGVLVVVVDGSHGLVEGVSMIGPESFKELGDLPERVKAAALELVAYAMNTDSQVLNVTLRKIEHAGTALPDFEISIRRI